MSQDIMKLRLTIVEGDQGARVEEIDGSVAPIKVGRLSSSHLRFEDSSVSRIHAVIEKSADGSYHLIDLGSASGTFVNGEKVTKQGISHGDELQFGNVVVKLEFVTEAQAPAMDFVGEATAISTIPEEPVAQPAQDAALPKTQAVPSVAAAPQPQVQQQPQQDWAAQQQPAPSVDVAQAASADPYAAAPQEQQQDPYASYDANAATNAYGTGSDYGASGGGDAYAGGLVTTADGSQVEPYTLQGYYDELGNYIPGYYDDQGEYYLGYGYYDEAGAWCVAYGYYDPQGEWIETEHAIASVDELGWQGPSDIEYYTESFFDGQGGDTLEVAMLWSDQVLAVNAYQQPRTVLIGSTKEVDFIIEDPALNSDAFPLISFDGGSYSITINEHMQGMVQNGEQRYTLAEAIQQGIARGSSVPGCYALPLGARTSARVDIGDVTFLAHFTDQPAIVGGPIGIDYKPIPFIVASAVAHLAFVFMALFIPVSPDSLELDGIAQNDRFVQAMIMPEQEEEEEPDWLGDGDGEEAAEKHKGEEGQAGKEDSEQSNKELAIKGPSDNQDIQLKRSVDTQVAMESGALAVLGDQVSSPFGAADSSVGSDAIHALGNLEGDGVGEAKGFGGLGVAGAGRGGGGISERGIGLATVGTKGKGGRGGGGGKYGRSAGDLGDKKTRVPKLVPGKPQVQGSLDKEIIRRVVRQHRNEIRYCYEKQLQKNPKLSGTVKVKFTISGTGSVISALVSSSSLKDSKVEQCMTSKIRRWVFPEPKGGGIVVVNYPFNFSS